MILLALKRSISQPKRMAPDAAEREQGRDQRGGVRLQPRILEQDRHPVDQRVEDHQAHEIGDPQHHRAHQVGAREHDADAALGLRSPAAFSLMTNEVASAADAEMRRSTARMRSTGWFLATM